MRHFTNWLISCFSGFVGLFTFSSFLLSIMLRDTCSRKQWISCFKVASNANKYYLKFPKYSDTQNICCYHSNIWTMWLYQRVMSPNDADGMANSVDPDQTAPPLGPVWSGSALFAQAYLSQNLGSLRYTFWTLGKYFAKLMQTWTQYTLDQ